MTALPATELPPQISPPRFTLAARLRLAARGDVVAFPVSAAGEHIALGPAADRYAAERGLDLLGLADLAGASAEAGAVAAVPVPEGDGDRLVLLVGVGDLGPADLRRAGAALARATREHRRVVTTVPAETPDEALEPFVVGMVLGSFDFRMRGGRTPRRAPREVVLAGVGRDRAGEVAAAEAVGGAAWRARLLATVPANVKTPAWLAAEAGRVAEEAGLECTVWDERELAARGMGGMLAVGRASQHPPRLIRLDYAPARVTRRTPTVVLVGKGITFDTGGLSLKPGEGMATMKRDMTGGGVVIAVMGALAAVGCPVRVVGLVPAAENAVGGDAMRPGDVVRHYGGRTSEVTNTDAEGRLVLADALAYAVDRLRPAALVDIATLTGAIRVALGQRMGGMFANDDRLAETLVRVAADTGEPLWRFPLHPDYEEKLSSKIADSDNAGSGPGAIIAALFLQHFVGGVPWAHLDVASAAESPTDEFEWNEGPTGFGARALLAWLRQDDPLEGIG